MRMTYIFRNVLFAASISLVAIAAFGLMPQAASADSEPTCSLSVSPSHIIESPVIVLLEWDTDDAHTVFIDNGVGFVNNSGSRAVYNVYGNRTFNLTATGSGGMKTCTASVTSEYATGYSAPTCNIYAVPRSTSYNGEVTLNWTSSPDAVEASLNHGIGAVQKNGSMVVRDITNARTYTLTVKNANRNQNTCGATVYIDKALPTCSLSFGDEYVRRGESTTLSWSVGNASSASISPNIGAVPTTGSVTIRPQTTTAYTMTAQGVVGGHTCSKTVNVYEGLFPPAASGLYGQFGNIFAGLAYPTQSYPIAQSAPQYQVTAPAYTTPQTSVSISQVPYTGPNDAAYVLSMLAIALSAFGGLYFLYRKTWRSAYAL
jgi:PKD repeat protein